MAPHRSKARALARTILLLLATSGSLNACRTTAKADSGSNAAAVNASTAQRPMTELNSSIIAVGDGDWLSDRCVNMVDRASKFKQSKIMFVPTLFWVQDGNGPVKHYCYDRRQDSQGKFSCEPADSAKIARFKAAMQRCFQKAIDAKLSIALTPHLDDGTGQGRWRNVLDFDPTTKHAGFSYAEVALLPLAEALNTIARPDTKIYFGMQGEMSVTVFRHPKAWRSLVRQLKDTLAQGRDDNFRNNIQIGISTNFNKLSGVGIEIIDPSEYVRRYPELWESVKHTFDLNEIHGLLDDIDYVGMSSYPSLSPRFPTRQVENAISQFDFEFSFFGVTVADLIAKGKKIHFSEYGVGGGISQNGDVKATDAAGAASRPFFGIFNAYKRSTDPWVLYDLNIPSEVRDYQRYFYGKTLEYLGNARRYKYQVDAAFLWNQSSWDVQAVYPESTTAEGSYRDPVIVDMINKHNTAAMAGEKPTAICADETPPGATYGCQQQAQWNKCGEDFMQGYCDKSCGRCQAAPGSSGSSGSSGGSSNSGSCTNQQPPGTNHSCDQQAAWNKCGEGFMQGFCNKSCGRCR